MPDNSTKAVGSFIQRAIDAGMSKTILVQKTGLSWPTLERILAGKHSANLATVEKIARALRLDPWQLICPDPVEAKKQTLIARRDELVAQTADLGIQAKLLASEDDEVPEITEKLEDNRIEIQAIRDELNRMEGREQSPTNAPRSTLLGEIVLELGGFDESKLPGLLSYIRALGSGGIADQGEELIRKKR